MVPGGCREGNKREGGGGMSRDAAESAVDSVSAGVVLLVAMAAMFCLARGCDWQGAVERDLDRRFEAARLEAVEIAEARAARVGGWQAYVHRDVNRWCRENGRPDAYPGEGSLDSDGNPID